MNNQTTHITPLCDACQTLDLLSTNNREETRYQLGTWEDVKTRANGDQGCPFCILLRLFVKRYFSESFAKGEVDIVWRPRGGFFVFGTTGDNLVFLNEDTAKSPIGCARVVQSQIDPALIKKWMKLCEVHHEETCAPKRSPIRTAESDAGVKVLRVIDTEDQCIVEALPDVRYLVLSYVWGPIMPSIRLERNNIAELSTKGALLDLRHHIPKTISEAIDLVKLIGERYLWVDSLCLIQDDDDDMLDGISHMDLVYHCAVLTIIEAHGVDANAGLPGLHPGSRDVVQDIIEVLPGIKMTTTTGVYNAMGFRSAGAHKTRGWTLQELVLSYRTLIFTEHRIYFRCHANCWSEDTIYDNFPTAINAVLDSGSRIDFLADNEPKPLQAFNSQLFRYNYRNLTKESDTVHGLMGILRFLSVQTRSGLLEGLFTSCFDISILFWDVFPDDTPPGRRLGFPSWSWAGWRGIGDGYGRFCKSSADTNSWLRGMTYIVWYKRCPGTADLELVWNLESQLKHGEPEERHIGYRPSLTDPYGRTIDVALENLRTTPDDKEDIHRTEIIREEMKKRNYHFLHFFAHVVLIKDFDYPYEATDEEGDDNSGDEDFKYGGKEKSSTMKLQGADGVVCGGILFDDPNLMKGVLGPHELVLLSKMDRFKDFFNDRFRFKRPFYWVMLIAWQGGEKLVAERRGIGFLFQDCIEHVLYPGKVWKEIVLA
ncbi:hypothetical protein GALMADRAFT_104107 [Galerina marginata CBS 339.88]|uniref:Heterokaryon incompatibility domain-containing protein n=1 Tax=Galerina marginata (strain CBS 339.88) TaxID=685588 RepID=A0A067SN71_GALM3|nr:hypothetical protein GALMADRAFT_104107 [Galerina marginata CBS 339.88]